MRSSNPATNNIVGNCFCPFFAEVLIIRSLALIIGMSLKPYLHSRVLTEEFNNAFQLGVRLAFQLGLVEIKEYQQTRTAAF